MFLSTVEYVFQQRAREPRRASAALLPASRHGLDQDVLVRLERLPHLQSDLARAADDHARQAF
jgi:hypothetical protein